MADLAARYHTVIELDHWPDAVFILNFDRHGGKRGDGARALTEFLKETDRLKLPVILVAAEGNPKLIEYYRRFGFLVQGVGSSQAAQNKWLRAHTVEYQEAVENGDDLEGVGMTRKPHPTT